MDVAILLIREEPPLALANAMVAGLDVSSASAIVENPLLHIAMELKAKSYNVGVVFSLYGLVLQ